MRKSEILALIIVIVSFLIAISVYPKMPQPVATHWNRHGEVDGYKTKFWGTFLVPFVLLGCLGLFIIIPRIDPLKANIFRFIKYYDRFMIITLIVLLIIQLWAIAWNLGRKMAPEPIFALVFGGLLYYTGVLSENAQRNWFVGIRTPWTISSETVWQRTHKLAGLLYRISGILSIIGGFFSRYAMYFIVGPVILVGLFLIIYSFIIYQRLARLKSES
ncbi:MAG: SdpI family protein [candidate division WOR-3 bacterium]